MFFVLFFFYRVGGSVCFFFFQGERGLGVGLRLLEMRWLVVGGECSARMVVGKGGDGKSEV